MVCLIVSFFIRYFTKRCMFVRYSLKCIYYVMHAFIDITFNKDIKIYEVSIKMSILIDRKFTRNCAKHREVV
jgi:hypothetical protein